MENKTIKNKFKISWGNDFLSRYYGISTSQEKLIKEMTLRVHGNVDKVLVRKLEKLIEKNPNVPQLKNFLSVASFKLGSYKRANEINDWMLQEHPNYLTAKINAANHFFHIGEPDKALSYLGENLDLKELYPERDEFHFTEVLSYYQATVMYAIAKGDESLARNRFDFLKSFDEENPRLEDLEIELDRLKWRKKSESYDTQAEVFGDIIGVEPEMTDVEEAPKFHHEEILQLYSIGFKDSEVVLNELLGLPRETLIQDLELVLEDAVIRYCYFLGHEWSVKTHSFLMHAIFLLMEVRSEESLPKLLDVLSYNEEFIEFYVGEFVKDSLCFVIYQIGKNQIHLLEEFLLKPEVYTYVKTSVSEVLVQVGTNFPTRKQEIVNVFEKVYTAYINANEGDFFIDTDFLELSIEDVANHNLIELLPVIEKLYQKEYIYIEMEDNFKAFQESIMSVDKGIMINLMSLSEIYNNTYFEEESENNLGMPNFQAVTPSKTKIIQMPISSVKVNRNDPCTCGSGKKYKKCCGS